MARLDAAGAGLDRISISSSTLHPQMLAWGIRWSRVNGSQLWTGSHDSIRTDAYLGSPAQFVRERNEVFHRRLEDLTDADHALLHELRREGLTDYAGVPMVFGNGTVNLFSLATARAGGFQDGDLERFEALANLIAPLFELIERRRMTLGLLDTFIGPRISERILRGQVKRGDGDRITAAFWYSDLRGFTELSEALPAPELLQLLNEYFECCAAAAAARGGEILQLIGDAVLIIFEIRGDSDRPAVCEAALDAAIDAFNAAAVLNHRRRRAGQPEIQFGLGLHVGEVTHANVGSPDRLAFNVVGPAVNRTARIQARTKDAGVPLLMSAEFAAQVRQPVKRMGRFELRGVAGTHEVFTPA